jgi:hypothetical protein
MLSIGAISEAGPNLAAIHHYGGRFTSAAGVPPVTI